MADEDRVIAIETKLAFLEDIVQSLNDTVVNQQQRISVLEEQYKNLVQRLASVSQSPNEDANLEERPPHY
jgi:SlyX protein